jgi:subtilisin family serine protease
VRAADTVVTDAAGRVRGTSAATPVVAGTVSHMIADGGRLSPGEVETIIRETADERRRLDPDAAVARADDLAGRQRGVTASAWTGRTSTNETSSFGETAPRAQRPVSGPTGDSEQT